MDINTLISGFERFKKTKFKKYQNKFLDLVQNGQHPRVFIYFNFHIVSNAVFIAVNTLKRGFSCLARIGRQFRKKSVNIVGLAVISSAAAAAD